MHRPLLCGIMCAYVCFVSKRVFCFFVCLCVWTHSCATLQSACQPSQSQPGPTGMGERLSLELSRHATPLLLTYWDGKNTPSYPGEMNLPVSVVQGRHRKSFELFDWWWITCKVERGIAVKKDNKDPSISIWRQLSNNASICCASNTNQVHRVSLLRQ